MSSEGFENLELMGHAKNYLHHVGKLVAKYLPSKGTIIDFGSGDGVQTGFVGVNPDSLLCVESNLRMRAKLQKLKYTTASDLESSALKEFDAAYSINCLEHILDDRRVAKQIGSCLKHGSRFIIFVPALPILFSSMDQRVGHVRRYSRRSLKELLENSGYSIEKMKFVDSLGVLFTLLYKAIGNKSGEPSVWSIKTYDRIFFPLSRLLDLLLNQIIGKNLLVVALKK